MLTRADNDEGAAPTPARLGIRARRGGAFRTILSLALGTLLLLMGGPGWALELCACGDEPSVKSGCCCCHSTQDGGASLARERVCERVAVDKAASGPTSLPGPSSEVAVPPGGVSLPRLAPATALHAAPPADTGAARGGSDPPYIRIRSLRI